MFNNKFFMQHWLGVALAQVGSFFTLLALPWLVLSMTNDDSSVMATAMALLTLPHTFLLLVGGAIADRFSSLVIIRICRSLLFLTMLVFSFMVYLQNISIGQIYLFSLLIGSFTALCTPAYQALVPYIIEKEHFSKANSLLIATNHIAQILGPVCAGWLIHLMVDSYQFMTLKAIAIAFMFDTVLLFLAAAIAFNIYLLKPIQRSQTKIISAIQSAIIFCYQHHNIKLVLCYLLVVSFFLHGPLMVVLPLLVKSEYALSTQHFGGLYALIGMGVIIGAGISFKWPVKDNAIGLLILLCDIVAGVCFVLFSSLHQIEYLSLSLIIIGTCMGLLSVNGITWFQKHTPDHFMGRVISILLFCIFGTVPISAWLTGLMIDYFSIYQVTSIFGFVLISFAIAGLIVPTVRNMGQVNQNLEISV